MGRLRPELLARAEAFSDRVLDVVETLALQRRPFRIVDQLTGSGTSVGANTFEADEAMSRADFCKSLSIIIKELNETRFWIRTVARRGWISPERLASLEAEAIELKLIYGTILTRSRQKRTPA